MNYQVIEVEKLKSFPLRDIRPHIVEKIKNLIEKDGFNPAKPLTVMAENGHYIVPDGNHRLQVLRDMGVKEVPCLIREGDPVQIGITCNRAEDTYAPMDLFDKISAIKFMKNEGRQNEEIKDIMDGLSEEAWSIDKVKQYSRILDESNISVEFLEKLKNIKRGRDTEKVSGDTFEFTEYWLRTTGIYKLNEKYQLEFAEWIDSFKNLSVRKKHENKINLLLSIQDQLEILKNLSSEIEDYENQHDKLRLAIENGEYTNTSLDQVIAKLNLGAKNKAYFGHDALKILKTLEDNSIDCVVTDPPWGVDFKSRRDTGNPDYDPNIDEIDVFLENVYMQLARVTKANAHIYVIFPIALYCKFFDSLSKYFKVDPIPLMWVKNNHAPRDFDKGYARMYEPIFFCTKESPRDMQGFCRNVLTHEIPRERWHDSQKPLSLLEELIKNSTGTGETVLDPFAGSGSTLLAAKKSGRYYIGIEKDNTYKSSFKRAEKGI